MNLNQEFHEYLQAGRISDAIALVVGQLIELKITTKANSGRLHTTVNLLNGQITNTVDPVFFSDKASQKLLEFHTNQITATAQVVREQLRSLQDLLQALPALEVVKPEVIKSTANEPESLFLTQPEIISSQQVSETLPVVLTAFADELPSLAVTDQPETLVAKATEHLNSPLAPAVKVVEHLPVVEPEPQVLPAPERLPKPQPEISVTPASEHLPEYQPEILVTQIPGNLTKPQPQPQIAVTEHSEIHFEPESFPANTEKLPVIDQSERVKLPEIPLNSKPSPRVGIASGLAAALANASALDPSEASAIPNKFDQALKSAGVRSVSEEELHPFGSNKKTADLMAVPPVIDQPSELLPKRELIDLLSGSDDDWDEWLLEEDNILSELSDVTKDRMPDLEAHWLSENGSTVPKSAPSDWEEFMPEYPAVNSVATKNQANVERFRQNLVNDPQLMSELLAELDDLEEMGDPKPKL
jgi:hypothetical protein